MAEIDGDAPPVIGIVRLNRFGACGLTWSRLSRGELTPFSKCDRAVLLEDIATVEVTFLVEVVVDRGMDGGEFLQGFYVPELRHHLLSSAEWLM